MDASAEPQRTGGLGLKLRREVSVVDAGEDLVGDGDRLGGVLGAAQYGQAATAQVQPLRLSGAHRSEGERSEFTRVIGTGAGQGFRRRDQDQGTGKVSRRRGGAGVCGSDQGLTEHSEVVVAQVGVQLTGTIGGEGGVDRLPDRSWRKVRASAATVISPDSRAPARPSAPSLLPRPGSSANASRTGNGRPAAATSSTISRAELESLASRRAMAVANSPATASRSPPAAERARLSMI